MSRLFGRLSPIKSLLKAFSSSDEVMECEACLTDAGVTVDISTSSALLFFSVYFSSLCCFFFLSLHPLAPLSPLTLSSFSDYFKEMHTKTNTQGSSDIFSVSPQSNRSLCVLSFTSNCLSH